MPDLPFHIPYCRQLDELTALLKTVERPGSFAASGNVVSPPPVLTIDGVGRISFPLPHEQAVKIAAAAAQAPYGRGAETLVDRSVRDVKQLEPSAFRLSGTQWPQTLATVVQMAGEGLGCADLRFRADLYKLLLYEPGGFFAAHRDTEKSPGMFGTLVVALPSEHEGGDLVVRHETGEQRITLTGDDEASALPFAAFYADCEHEVLPIDSGFRLCLVYNLVRIPDRKVRAGKIARATPAAPDYREIVGQVTRRLNDWAKRKDHAVKIAWLLEHEYTPEGLDFSTLKLQDAARVQVLRQAADRADMEIHLGLVHLTETGAAEVDYHYGYRRRRRRHYWNDDDEEEEEERVQPDDYELIEAFDWSRTVDEWIDRNGRRVDYGPIPLEDDELLPAGALDNQKPDHIHVSEATGNEGGSYERSYHRAAAILWPRSSTEDVLLQAGAAAAVPHFARLVAVPFDEREDREILDLAKRIIARWPVDEDTRFYYIEDKHESAARVMMLRALNDYGDPLPIEGFLSRVVIPSFCGGPDAVELIRSMEICPEQTVRSRLLPDLVGRRAKKHFPELAEWFALAVTSGLDVAAARAATKALEAALPALPAIPRRQAGPQRRSWRSYDFDDLDELEELEEKKGKESLDDRRAGGLMYWLAALHPLPDYAQLVGGLVSTVLELPTRFPPDSVLWPVLTGLSATGEFDLGDATDPLLPLWIRTAEFLLERSSKPPAGPLDWKLRNQKLSCKCKDCAVVMTFAQDPGQQILRLPMNKQRRQHLHGVIDEAGLEMTHETERRGSPQTLVLAKTRWRHDARVKEYRSDLERMAGLIRMAERSAAPRVADDLVKRMRQARARRAE